MSIVATDSARQFLEALVAPAGGGPLTAARQRARERFAESGFPNRRHENWKFTDLKPLIDARFNAARSDNAAFDRLIETLPADVDRIVLRDGHFDEARSRIGELPKGAVVGSFARWTEHNADEAVTLLDAAGGQDNAFRSLNAAFFTDGFVVLLPDDCRLERPIHVVHWNGGTAAHLKSLVRLGARATARLVQSFAGTGDGWTNTDLTLALGDSAELGRYVLQEEADGAFHTSRIAARIGKAARLDGFLLNLGARLSREDGELTLAGSHGYCGYSGSYLLGGRQESSIASVIRHAAPNCSCREVFKGCIGDQAHGVFQGKIHVEPDAQKTDGYQLNKTILLGDRAVMDAKPELEIYADDVKCSHGATVGDLDETALFYLRSRGIDPDAARSMLVEAFVMDGIDQIADAGARAWLTAAVTRRLGEQA